VKSTFWTHTSDSSISQQKVKETRIVEPREINNKCKNDYFSPFPINTPTNLNFQVGQFKTVLENSIMKPTKHCLERGSG
jgi:hypothetical protein